MVAAILRRSKSAIGRGTCLHLTLCRVVCAGPVVHSESGRSVHLFSRVMLGLVRLAGDAWLGPFYGGVWLGNQKKHRCSSPPDGMTFHVATIAYALTS